MPGRYRVAVVAAGDFPSPRGSQALIAGIAGALAARGHEVHTVAHGDADARGALPSGILLHRPRRLRRATTRHGRAIVRLREAVALFAKLFRVVRDRHIQVVHAHNYEGALIALAVRALRRVPVIYHAHNVLGDELPYYLRGELPRRVAGSIGRWLDRAVPKRADLTVALTPEVASYLAERGDAARVRVLAPLLHERPAIPLRAFGDDWAAASTSAGLRVAYAGNFDGYQALDVLAEGFARFAGDHPGAELWVVTHERPRKGELPEALERAVGTGAARVVVREDPAATIAMLRQADVLVCPRSSWSGYPMKLLNYFAAGKPVVVARGSAKHVRDGENGLVFEDGRPHSLAEALARLAREPELRRKLAGAAAATLLDLPDAATVGRDLEDAYASLRIAPSAPNRGSGALCG